MARSSSDQKKKSNAASGGSSTGSLARAIGETLGMLFRPLVPLTTLVVIYAGISYLLWRPLNGEAGTNESLTRARLGDRALRAAIPAAQRPAWISPQDFRQIVADGVFTAAGHSVFEPGLSRRLASAYQRNIWVERVRAVRLRYPAQMGVELEFRKPCARIENGAVLDRQGYALNLSTDNPFASALPILSGVTQHSPATGHQAADRPVLDGLDLLAVVRDALAQSPGSLRVTRLEHADGKWTVVLANGPRVLWGVFSDEPPLGEPRTSEKALLLRRRLCESKDPSLLESVKVYVAQAPVKPRDIPGAEVVPVPEVHHR